MSGATSATFVYDGDGNRVKATFGTAPATSYVGSHFEWITSTTTMVKYYYAGGQRVAMRVGDGASSTVSYLLGDHLGSTSLTANSSGGKVAELRYHPWGSTRFTDGATPTARRFTGQIEDAGIGLYFYNARYYDPALGRFIQADTIVPSPANPQSLNRYSYVLNNPLRYTDPSGHWWEDPNSGALMPGYSPKSLPASWRAGKGSYRDSPPPTPFFERLPLVPTKETTSQWFGGTNFAYMDGNKWNYDGYCQGFHCGVDIGRETSEYGEPVYAGIYGSVESTGNTYGAGPYAVNIRVGNYIVIHGHLDGKYSVKKGDVVTPDTIIGGVGNPKGIEGKGNVHLHLEIRYQNRLIYNPLLFMDASAYQALATVIDPNDFHYTDKWATPLDQPVIQRGGPSLWKE